VAQGKPAAFTQKEKKAQFSFGKKFVEKGKPLAPEKHAGKCTCKKKKEEGHSY